MIEIFLFLSSIKVEQIYHYDGIGRTMLVPWTRIKRTTIQIVFIHNESARMQESDSLIICVMIHLCVVFFSILRTRNGWDKMAQKYYRSIKLEKKEKKCLEKLVPTGTELWVSFRQCEIISFKMKHASTFNPKTHFISFLTDP